MPLAVRFLSRERIVLAASGSSDDEVVPFVVPGLVVPHFERFVSVGGDAIRIECDCPIGREHTYADWVARFVDDDG